VPRGSDYVEGWPAIAWVAGTGAGLLLTAGLLWLSSYAFPATTPVLASYRTEARGPGRREDLRGLAVLLVALCVITQLLYVGLYIELVQWRLGARQPPRVFSQIFFWVFLVDATCAGASLYTGLKRPD
jgi:hypothetical protein